MKVTNKQDAQGIISKYGRNAIPNKYLIKLKAVADGNQSSTSIPDKEFKNWGVLKNNTEDPVYNTVIHIAKIWKPILVSTAAIVITCVGFWWSIKTDIRDANQKILKANAIIEKANQTLDHETNLRKIYYSDIFIKHKDKSSSNPFADSILYYDERLDTFKYTFYPSAK